MAWLRGVILKQRATAGCVTDLPCVLHNYMFECTCAAPDVCAHTEPPGLKRKMSCFVQKCTPG